MEAKTTSTYQSGCMSSLSGRAKTRRDVLRARGVYKAAKTVSNSGLRVAWPGLVQQRGDIKTGEVMGVGLKPISDMRLY
jgi:hypothetical protein